MPIIQDDACVLQSVLAWNGWINFVIFNQAYNRRFNINLR